MVLLTLLATAVGAFAVFCLMLVGLVETPWPILLGGLLLALYGLQRLSVQSQLLADQTLSEMAASADAEKNTSPELPAPTAEPQPAQPELMYRGIRYSPTDRVRPAAKAPAGDTAATSEGTYRGQSWQHTKVTSLVQPGSVPELTYRGRKVKRPQGSKKTS
jgi:hypothetical protein